jgi:Tat protein translocase TatB subunit
MFGIGMPEMLMILAVALIVIGPKKLPDLAKSLGRAMGEFKRATSDLKSTIQSETGLDDVRDTIRDVNSGVRDALSLEDPASTPIGAYSQEPEKPDGSSDSTGEGPTDAPTEVMDRAGVETPSDPEESGSSALSSDTKRPQPSSHPDAATKAQDAPSDG